GPSMRMSARGRNSLAALTVSTAPPCRMSAMSAPALAGGAAAGRGSQEIAEIAQPFADVVDHQAGGRREPAIARHQDADTALCQARLDQWYVHQFDAADLVEEADRREEAEAQPGPDPLAAEFALI